MQYLVFADILVTLTSFRLGVNYRFLVNKCLTDSTSCTRCDTVSIVVSPLKIPEYISSVSFISEMNSELSPRIDYTSS